MRRLTNSFEVRFGSDVAFVFRARERRGIQPNRACDLIADWRSPAPGRHMIRRCYAILRRTINDDDRQIVTSIPSKELATFPNPKPERDYTIRIDLPEFTCLCPLTGQPDFAHILLEYIPGESCVELKALKLYIWSFRDEGGFHEAITNQILDDVIAACNPRFARVTATFNVRGGTYPKITAEFSAPGWQAPPLVVLP